LRSSRGDLIFKLFGNLVTLSIAMVLERNRKNKPVPKEKNSYG
jgi:hypothetical protein